jgi:protein-L-isoaspartate(D-aspartate) O-methyltransferase
VLRSYNSCAMRAIVNDQTFETMRRAMVSSQLRTNAVSDPQVVAAIETVPREDFVPEARRASAYVDIAVPLGDGRALNPPMATGRMINEVGLQAGDNVLIIGAATGYTAAIVAQLAGKVVALEEDTALAARATTLLAKYGNVTVVTGPLNAAWAEGAPYDVIIFDGAVQAVPDHIVHQLADGGRLATGLSDKIVTRLAVGRRVGTGFGLNSFADAQAVVLPGFASPKGFSF